MGSQCYDVRFVAGVLLCSNWGPSPKMCDLLPVTWARSGVPGVLGSKWVPSAEMYDLLHVSSTRSGVPVLRCTICCRMHDLLPVSWVQNGVSALRCMICCRCLGLEVVSKCYDVRFVAGVLGSRWGRNAKMNDLLPVSRAGSGSQC